MCSQIRNSDASVWIVQCNKEDVNLSDEILGVENYFFFVQFLYNFCTIQFLCDCLALCVWIK